MRTSTIKLKSTLLLALGLICGIGSLNAQKGNFLDARFEEAVLYPSLEEFTAWQSKGSYDNTTGDLKTPPSLDLALTKELAQGQSLEVEPGDWVTFTIYVHNQGSEAATSIVIADYIPGGMTLMDSNWLSDIGHAYYIMPGPLAPNTTSQIDIHFLVNEDAPHDAVVNCAEIGSATVGGLIVFNDIDSTFDANPDNDGLTTDNELNNNNNDEDDHDCAYVKVLGSGSVDPCPGGVVDCPIDSFCAMPVTPITICPDICGITGNYTITDSQSAFHCSLVPAGGCITYTPVPGMEIVGSDLVSLTIVSDEGCTYNYTANVSIGNCSGNTFPVAIFDEVHGNCTGVGINPLVNDSDANGDIISVCGFDQASNGTVTQIGDIIYYTPDPGFFGVDEFLYTICDGNGGTAQANIIVNVSLCNSAPVADNDFYTTNCDKIFMYVLDNDFDPDGTPVTICDFSEPTSGTLLFWDTFFSFIPAGSYNGPVSFTYTLCDPDGLTSTATVSIDVEGCNSAPIAENDSYTSTCEKIWMHVLDNDFDVDGGEYICDFTDPGIGSLFFWDTFFTYIPAAGHNGPVTFEYTLCDPQGLQSVATVTIEISCNVAPIAAPDTYDATCFKFDLFVLDNDSDPDGGPITICDYTEPTHGSVIFFDSFFSYIPPADFTGPVTFTYTICDEYGLTSVTNVTINVVCGCTNPIINACTGPLQGIELCPEFCDLSGPYELTGAHSSWDCSITQNDNGCITYLPLPGFFGVDTVTLDACDEFGNCDTSVINVTVGDCNQSTPPQAIGDVYNVNCTTTILDVLGNDVNTAGGALTICDFDAVTIGTLLFNNNTFTYTPPADLVGLVSFTYTVCNEAGESSQANVTINYNCIVCDDGPFEECVAPQTPLLLCPEVCALNDFSITGGESTYHCSVTIQDQCVQYVAVPGFFGQDIVTLTACDNSGNCIDIIYHINVGDCSPSGTAPVAIFDEVAAGCNLLFIDVTANDLSPSGEAISICDFTQPTFGSVVLINGQFQYNSSPGFNGVDEFFYTLCSENGPGNSALVTINVGCGNGSAVLTATNDIINAGCNMTKLIVLFNDVSSTGETLVICGFNQPSFGSVYQGGDFLFYTPNEGFNGNDTVEYTVCDESGNSDTATAFINVDCNMTGPNAPLVKDDLVFGGCDFTKVVALGNDVSVDGDILTICDFTQPANGVVTAGDGDGFLFYTPNDGFTGNDTFQYTACDEQGAAATANVTMVVECDPICVDGELEACTQSNVPIDLCVNFCSPGATLNNVISTLNANIVQLGGNCFRYVSNFSNTKDLVAVSYCNEQTVCETIMIEISVDASCTNPGFSGQTVPELALEEKCKINFPNGFSPNGDGVNEVFRPLDATGCYEHAAAEVKIFNGHGQVVCEIFGELKDLSWDGKFTSSDDKVLPDTYFYVISVEGDDTKEIFKGFIEVR